MSLGAPAAADVPDLFDVVINGHGFVFAREQEADSASVIPRATYSYSPTFVERSNTQGDYGDNQQDFWMTFSQHDWSLGEQQKYYRVGDADRRRRYWTGSRVNVREEGQATIRAGIDTLSFSESITVVAGFGTNLLAGGTAHLWRVSTNESITDLGLHSLTTAPTTIAVGDRSAYVSALNGTGIAKWDGSTLTQFATSPCASLAVLGNALYGHRSTQSDLVRFDTAGVLESLYTWQDPDGNVNSEFAKVAAFGGKLLILRTGNKSVMELWLYDGVAPSKIADFPADFISTYNADPLQVLNGVVYVSGFETTSLTGRRGAIYYYANGSVGLLWRSDTVGTYANLPMAAWDGGLVFADPNAGKLFYYNPVEGGVSSYGAFTAPSLQLGASYYALLLASGGSPAYFYPASTTASTATVSTSLFDGDSALTKYFSAVKVDFDAASDGDGGSVSISYQLNTVAGNYTSVQSAAASGTEYTIGQSGRSISIQVTLNKGTSTAGPTLKRIYVRAVPVQQSFPLREYVLDLSGVDGRGHPTLNSGQTHPLDGVDQATQLIAAVTSTSPVSITDRFGTYTGVLEPDGFSLRENRPEEYLAVVRTRGV